MSSKESLKAFIFIIDPIELKLDILISDLDLFKELGVIKVAKQSCIIKINNENTKNKLTIFILFSPEVHKITSSLCLSNFCIDNDKARRKDKGINFVIIFVTLKNEKRR